MEHKDNLLGVLSTLFKWKKAIILLCLAVGVGSAIIVLLLPVYYQATTIFFAASSDLAKPEILFNTGAVTPEYYGNENDIDRLLTIGESNDLVEFMVDSFNLYEHYDIEPDNPRASYYVKQAFFGLYELTKTKRDAIMLSIEDKDQERAALMAQTAREKINAMAQQMIKESQLKTIRTFENDIVSKERILNMLSDSLRLYRNKYGIYNSEAQTEGLTNQYSEVEAQLIYNRGRLESLRGQSGVKRDTISAIEAKVAGLEKSVESLAQKLERFNEGMSIVATLERQYLEANSSLSEDKERLKQYQAANASQISAIILVEEAQKPVIKSRPKRTFVVLAAVAIAFIFSIIGVLLFDNYRDVDWREIYHGR